MGAPARCCDHLYCLQLSSLCDRHVGVKLWSISYQLDFAGGSDGEESACDVGDLGWIPGLGRSPGEGKGYLFQYSGLESSMDCIVRGVAKSQTRLTFTFLTVYPESSLL